MEMFALREMVNAPLPPPEEGRAENLLFPFATGLSGTQNLDKRAVSSISGSPEGTGGCERVKLELHSPSSLASGQLWAVREGGQSHYSRTLCQNAGKCVNTPTPLRTGNETPSRVPAFPLAAPPRVRQWVRWCH